MSNRIETDDQSKAGNHTEMNIKAKAANCTEMNIKAKAGDRAAMDDAPAENPPEQNDQNRSGTVKPLILVVEDDRAVKNLIITALEMTRYRFHTAETGQQAIMAAASYRPDVIFLDLGLPDMDGVEVIRKIRSWCNTPIIVISARSDDEDKITALDEGADDYLTKPFSVEELLARLRVTLRRIRYYGGIIGESHTTFVNGPLKIDYEAGCAYIDDAELHLTPIEYKLLCLLARNVGKVLTHNYILKEVWGSTYSNEVPSLRVFMATLRKKLEGAPGSPSYIQTHVGVGYRMVRIAD